MAIFTSLQALKNIGNGNMQAFPAYEPEPTVAASTTDDDDDFYNYDLDEFDDDEAYEDEDEVFELDESILDTEDSETFTTPDLGDLNISEGMDSRALRTDALQSIDLDQLRQALAQAKQQNDTPRILQIHKAIGKVQVGQDKETEAITTYNEILELYESEGDNEGVLDTLNMLGSLLTKTGNSQAAVMHATRGIQLANEANDSITELQMHMILGDARQDLGETASCCRKPQKSLRNCP